MKRILKSVAVLSILSMAGAVPVLAQQTQPMPGMTIPMKPGATAAEGSMMSAMDKMSKDMAAIPITGDADRDFVGMMIPHHQGAIDMANFELAHGKDPAIRKLARAIIAAQNKEIAGMKAWQAKHPGAR
jgi:uncharacterized protein (DUF305 family)